jgi:RHS repeat-associated protein
MTAATYTYDSWGNITTSTSTSAMATTNPWHYADSLTDAATGYLKLGARYYNPTTARFTNPTQSVPAAATPTRATTQPTESSKET